MATTKTRDQSQLTGFDFTLAVCGTEAYDKEDFTTKFNLIEEYVNDKCKNYAFQLEKGNITQRYHFQGRIKFKHDNRIRLGTLVKNNPLPGAHWSITSNNTKNFDYCMKEDTRIEGPWTDPENRPAHVPRDIKDLVFRPWQKQLADWIDEYCHRKIQVIYNPPGGIGKTTFTKWLMFYKGAFKLQSTNNAKELTQFASSAWEKAGRNPIAQCFIFDLPRSFCKANLAQMYCAIEDIKGGILQDGRHTARNGLLDPPRVYIFTNELPDKNYVSHDRWEIFEVNDKQELVLANKKYGYVDDEDIDPRPEITKLQTVFPESVTKDGWPISIICVDKHGNEESTTLDNVVFLEDHKYFIKVETDIDDILYDLKGDCFNRMYANLFEN